MADSPTIVVSNVLCYLVNKLGNVPAKPLKTIASDFFSSEDLADAKDLLLNVIDSLKMNNFPKISRRRRDSVNKPALDIEDIFTSFNFLDENRLWDKLPTFVATSPTRMPSSGLSEGDLQILLSKLNKLELFMNNSNDNYSIYNNSVKEILDTVLQLAATVSSLSSSLEVLREGARGRHIVSADNKIADNAHHKAAAAVVNGWVRLPTSLARGGLNNLLSRPSRKSTVKPSPSR